MSTTTNGQVRKTLASQIDRLHGILDGLSDNLNEAVATAVEGAVERAVKQAVGEAVRETLQAIITEVVSNPDLLAAARTLLTPGSTADVPADPPERPRGLFRLACDKVQASCGSNRSSIRGVRYSVTTSACPRSAVNRSFCSTFTRSATPRSFASARACSAKHQSSL